MTEEEMSHRGPQWRTEGLHRFSAAAVCHVFLHTIVLDDYPAIVLRVVVALYDRLARGTDNRQDSLSEQSLLGSVGIVPGAE